MEKLTAVVFLVLIGGAFAIERYQFTIPKTSGRNRLPAKRAAPGIDLCPTCDQFATSALNDLLQIIVNGGLLGSCKLLCGKLSAEWEQTVCMLVCSAVGIDVFEHFITQADLDPLDFCMDIGLCPHNDNASAVITNFAISPENGHLGDTFTFSWNYQIVVTPGTGVVGLEIQGPAGPPLATMELLPNEDPGNYGVSFRARAVSNENQQWGPGSYQATAFICEGDCNLKHQYNKVLDTATGNFTIASQ